LCPLPGPATLLARAVASAYDALRLSLCRKSRVTAAVAVTVAVGWFFFLCTPLQRSITTHLALIFSARIVTLRGLLPCFITSKTSQFRFFTPAAWSRAECLPQEHISGSKPGVMSQPAIYTIDQCTEMLAGKQRTHQQASSANCPFCRPCGRAQDPLGSPNTGVASTNCYCRCVICCRNLGQQQLALLVLDIFVLSRWRPALALVKIAFSWR
jgi:hypothetical protein